MRNRWWLFLAAVFTATVAMTQFPPSGGSDGNGDGADAGAREDRIVEFSINDDGRIELQTFEADGLARTLMVPQNGKVPTAWLDGMIHSVPDGSSLSPCCDEAIAQQRVVDIQQRTIERLEQLLDECRSRPEGS